MKRAAVIISLLVVAVTGFFFGLLPKVVEQRTNTVSSTAPSEPASSQAQQLFDRLFVADLHSDSLLWNRDLNDDNDYGHVDVPRLVAGNVALQAFTVATQFPRSYDPAGTRGDSDVLGLLALAQRWPTSTWTGVTERALYQAAKLEKTAMRSEGRLAVVRSADDLRTFLERRSHTPAITAGFLGLEGAHALEGDIDNLNRLHEAGFRMLGLTHVFDNDVGGSGTGLEKGGFTEFGRQVIDRAGELGIIIDLAHASEALIDDALQISDGPFLVSHTGVRATCDNGRNLSDDHVRRIARTGGLIGIGFFEIAVCGTSVRRIAEALTHVVRIAGAQHAALGSDFDGGVVTPFDVTGLVYIVDELLQLGVPEPEIALIMGGNIQRFLLDALP